MTTATLFSTTRCLFSTAVNLSRNMILPAASYPRNVAPAYTNPVICMTVNRARFYSDGEWRGKGKEKGALKEENRGKAWCDMSPDVDPVCPVLREKRQYVKKGIIHKIKLKILEGGSNFGSKFIITLSTRCFAHIFATMGLVSQVEVIRVGNSKTSFALHGFKCRQTKLHISY